MKRSPRHHPRAFTLVEVIVVIAVVAILATMMVPRLMGQKQRQLQAAADGVSDLLMMFAQREALSDRPVGIWHDAERNWIVLMRLEPVDGDDREPATWQPDHAVKPVKLPDDHVMGPMIAIGKGVKDPWPKPGQLTLDEVVIENTFD